MPAACEGHAIISGTLPAAPIVTTVSLPHHGVVTSVFVLPSIIEGQVSQGHRADLLSTLVSKC